jgi:hypothetical protein
VTFSSIFKHVCVAQPFLFHSFTNKLHFFNAARLSVETGSPFIGVLSAYVVRRLKAEQSADAVAFVANEIQSNLIIMIQPSAVEARCGKQRRALSHSGLFTGFSSIKGNCSA